MWHDPIIEELHQIREEHAKKFNEDLKKRNDSKDNLYTVQTTKTICFSTTIVKASVGSLPLIS